MMISLLIINNNMLIGAREEYDRVVKLTQFVEKNILSDNVYKPSFFERGH